MRREPRKRPKRPAPLTSMATRCWRTRPAVGLEDARFSRASLSIWHGIRQGPNWQDDKGQTDETVCCLPERLSLWVSGPLMGSDLDRGCPRGSPRLFLNVSPNCFLSPSATPASATPWLSRSAMAVRVPLTGLIFLFRPSSAGRCGGS